MKDYGTCPNCHTWRPLTKAGVLRWHQGERGTVWELKECLGAGQKPLEDPTRVIDAL